MVNIGLVPTGVFLFPVKLFFFERESHSVTHDEVQWQSQLTATSTSQVQAILLPQPPE